VKYSIGSLLLLLASIPLVILLLNRRTAPATPPTVRIAVLNAALQRAGAGELLQELRGGGSEQARTVAAIVQHNEVDVLLVCELDRDADAAAAGVFAREYLAVGQQGQSAIEFPFVHAAPVNTGEPTGLDVDGDGSSEGPADAHGFGSFPGQYGMALFSRHPIVQDRVRTFRTLPWSAMPQPLRPEGIDDATWARLRLSSKSHWDVPIFVDGQQIHLLCSHPTPPVFDGPEDRNGCRNHDEIRFWVDYLTAGAADWIVDDQGQSGGLPPGAHFVVLGDLNCDPEDGDGRREALRLLLAHPRVRDPEPRSAGAEEQAKRQWGQNATHRGAAALDTADFEDLPGQGPGNLRVDYALPSRSLRTVDAGVFWPLAHEPASAWVGASDHRLVFVDVALPRPPG
jgi:hypothetical protein